ncbi:DnaA regulatory inactivator Hda [Ectothiorhodospira sp. BSL-9]|uniref:DnaA regulatory inactivator Hda n=1 Tax=Ectothiorhodospira sp. BSL-9 TaxID=1442136 RepID=UPI0007B4400A|nr:DnaA regulatory inactivator Hda [Ectothiorhodospira sp. BSL-9]ANB02420.1 hypothetical protein ECTOBSL9_1807 [Ectothiorhodospira sp. BSL-9]
MTQQLTQQLTLDVALRDGATFDVFHSGDHPLGPEAVRAAAQGIGEPQVYLFGEAGCGKTHLLEAACHEVCRAGGRIAYLPMGLLADSGPGVLDGWEGLDLIALDDLDRMPRAADFERALFDFINRQRDAGTRLLLASRTAPQSLSVALPDLRSRLLWGPVFQLHELSDVHKREVLVRRAHRRGFDLPPDACDYLLRHKRRDLTSLMGLLDRLDKASLRDKRKITLPFVRKVLQAD